MEKIKIIALEGDATEHGKLDIPPVKGEDGKWKEAGHTGFSMGIG
jgi:hypothetical protein